MGIMPETTPGMRMDRFRAMLAEVVDIRLRIANRHPNAENLAFFDQMPSIGLIPAKESLTSLWISTDTRWGYHPKTYLQMSRFRT